MNDKQYMALLLQAEVDHLRTALKHVKEMLPDDFHEEREETIVSVRYTTVPILDPVYNALSNIDDHIKMLMK